MKVEVIEPNEFEGFMKGEMIEPNELGGFMKGETVEPNEFEGLLKRGSLMLHGKMYWLSIYTPFVFLSLFWDSPF